MFRSDLTWINESFTRHTSREQYMDREQSYTSNSTGSLVASSLSWTSGTGSRSVCGGGARHVQHAACPLGDLVH